VERFYRLSVLWAECDFLAPGNVKRQDKQGIVVRLIEKNLESGDHIYVRRKGLLYSHHGIYAGDGTVIHFRGVEREKRDPAVVITGIENFLNSGKLKRRSYKKRLPNSETIRIARRHLSEKGYSIAFNNCEHFATYCATGKKKSRQVRRAVSGIIGVTLAVTATVIRNRPSRKQR
jgi:cell wall-associated NlpC family hydrolase